MRHEIAGDPVIGVVEKYSHLFSHYQVRLIKKDSSLLMRIPGSRRMRFLTELNLEPQRGIKDTWPS
jgi:hypothetical protein